MYQGFIDEGQPGTLLFQIEDGDAAPTWRLYAANGVVANGTGSAASLESGNVTGATDASPVVITSAAHGLSTGQRVTVANVGGTTGANGTHTVTRVGADTFSLDGSTGGGAYSGGGTWKATGLYRVTLSGSVLSSLAAGTTYTLVIHYALSAVAKAMTATFTVR
jgi:hypothetical protein